MLLLLPVVALVFFSSSPQRKCTCRKCCPTCFARLLERSSHKPANVGAVCKKQCPICTTDCPLYCSGPYRGCGTSHDSPAEVAVDDSRRHRGCFGESLPLVSKGGTEKIVGGVCVCSTGEFMRPEIYSVGGSIEGMLSGEKLTLQVHQDHTKSKPHV